MSDSDEEYENNRASAEEAKVGRSISETFISSSKLC